MGTGASSKRRPMDTKVALQLSRQTDLIEKLCKDAEMLRSQLETVKAEQEKTKQEKEAAEAEESRMSSKSTTCDSVSRTSSPRAASSRSASPHVKERRTPRLCSPVSQAILDSQLLNQQLELLQQMQHMHSSRSTNHSQFLTPSSISLPVFPQRAVSCAASEQTSDSGAGTRDLVQVKRVAILTAGNIAPCPSATVGCLIERYHNLYPEVEIMYYSSGFRGLLQGQSVVVSEEACSQASTLKHIGGSVIGSSRVMLNNHQDCVRRGLVPSGEDPAKVAAKRLLKDGVDVVFAIGGDDVCASAADLASAAWANQQALSVIAVPQAIENDISPVRQTIGAYTAAEEGAKFFENVVNDQSSSPRTLIIHEVMSRQSGYLAASTAREYRQRLKDTHFPAGFGFCREKMDVHAVYIPEMPVNLNAEALRLKEVMDTLGCVNIILSEGAAVDDILRDLEAKGEAVPRDARTGEIRKDAIQPSSYFGNQFARMLKAEKVMVQKSGHFARSAPANHRDLQLINAYTERAVEYGMRGLCGVVAHDEDASGKLCLVDFEKIQSGKSFDTSVAWFSDMIKEITATISVDKVKFSQDATSSARNYVPALLPGMCLPRRVAILASGGTAPCVSSSIGALIERYTELYPSVEMICYVDGFKGLVSGDYAAVTDEVREDASLLHSFGGSVIGSSRLKLTDASEWVARGLLREGVEPVHAAADVLMKDRIDVLHTIGGKESMRSAHAVQTFLASLGYEMATVGVPKVIDNDVFPFRQALGSTTVVEESVNFFSRIVNEQSGNPRMFIIHEVLGRSSGYITANTARLYKEMLENRTLVPEFGLSKSKQDIHAVYIPEMNVNMQAEAERLKEVMKQNGCVNIFLSEGACIEEVAREMLSSGQDLPRDREGQVRYDAIRPCEWFAKHFASLIGAEKVLVQKSAYYARSAAPNKEDLRLIKGFADHAVDCALRRQSGVVGHDEERCNTLCAVDFKRMQGGRQFQVQQTWFQDLLASMGQQQKDCLESHLCCKQLSGHSSATRMSPGTTIRSTSVSIK